MVQPLARQLAQPRGQPVLLLQPSERQFLEGISAAAPIAAWGYVQRQTGQPMAFEGFLHTETGLPLYYMVTAYSDNLFRLLQEELEPAGDHYTDLDYILQKIENQTNWSKEPKSSAAAATSLLNEFLALPAAASITRLADHPVLKNTSWHMAALIVAARQLLLLANRCYTEAYRLGNTFHSYAQPKVTKPTPLPWMVELSPEEEAEIEAQAMQEWMAEKRAKRSGRQKARLIRVS
jgi:hypothetical protein